MEFGEVLFITTSSDGVQKSLMAVSSRHLGKEVPDLPEAWGGMSQNTRLGSFGDEANVKFPVNVIWDSARVLERSSIRACRCLSEYALTISYQVVASGAHVGVPGSNLKIILADFVRSGRKKAELS